MSGTRYQSAVDSDVVVVGCGVAGLSAALSAAQEGASVRILERAPQAQRGGSTRYTSANMRLKSETELADGFADDLAQTSEALLQPEFVEKTLKPYAEWPPLLRAYPFADPELVRAFADNVSDSIAWLKTLGLRFEREVGAHVATAVPRLTPVGGGEEIVARLAHAAEREGVSFHYETTARSLSQNERGEITGVHAWSSSKGAVDFKAKAVILASGGFEGNPEMLTKYLGEGAYLLRAISWGTMYNKGEGIRMALEVGAAPAGQYDGFHGEPVDPRTSGTESIVAFPHGILVNQRGERFVDEASNYSDAAYDDVSRAIWRQPGGKAYFIYDSKIEDIKNYKKAIRTDKPPIEARSVEELASKLGIRPSSLKRTVQAYNTAIQEGEFDPSRLDGKHTEGIEPPKSNWARSIEGPEFMAYPLICAIVFTYGGIKISPRARVLNRDGHEIPGLYAAGEVVGLYYRNYLGGTSVLRGLVFGRIAGKEAAKGR